VSKGEQCHTVRTPVPALFVRPRAEVRSAYSSLHCSFSLLIFQVFAQDNIFITPPQFLAAVGPVAVGTGDFNGDGKLDLAVLNGCPAAGAVFQVSCGGSKSSTGMSSGTPAGTYTVTITRSSTTQHTASLTVNVQ